MGNTKPFEDLTELKDRQRRVWSRLQNNFSLVFLFCFRSRSFLPPLFYFSLRDVSLSLLLSFSHLTPFISVLLRSCMCLSMLLVYINEFVYTDVLYVYLYVFVSAIIIIFISVLLFILLQRVIVIYFGECVCFFVCLYFGIFKPKVTYQLQLIRNRCQSFRTLSRATFMHCLYCHHYHMLTLFTILQNTAGKCPSRGAASKALLSSKHRTRTKGRREQMRKDRYMCFSFRIGIWSSHSMLSRELSTREPAATSQPFYSLYRTRFGAIKVSREFIVTCVGASAQNALIKMFSLYAQRGRVSRRSQATRDTLEL